MNASSTALTLRVAEARSLNPLIKLLRLCADGGGVLPGFTAGARVRVQVALPGGVQDWRDYSLINWQGAPGATQAPTSYLMAVRKEVDGRGGSLYMHAQVHEGQLLTIEPPQNDFTLHTGAGNTVLLAGGIGVTPMVSMAAQRRAEGLPVRLHYAGRSRESMAFLPELQALLGDALQVHADDEKGGPLAIAAVLDACLPTDHLYVCGPQAMLDAVLGQCQERGWAQERVHFELFAAPQVKAGDQPFTVELAQSGQSWKVAAGQSLLDCLVENGCDPMFDCKRGECGVCTTTVLEGEIDHRDYYLSAAEKAKGVVMQICVSRAKGARLVLDL